MTRTGKIGCAARPWLFRQLTAGCAALFSMVLSPGAWAEMAGDDEGWRFEIAPYAWAVSLHGDAGADGNVVPVDSSFRDVFRESDSLLGAMLHVEAGRGRWSVIGDIAYAQVGVDDIPSEVGEVDARSSLLWAELAGAYRLIDHRAQDTASTFTLDALAGARLTRIRVELDLPGPDNDVDDRHTWVEPLVGARARWNIGERWIVSARGDIGGFGAGSDFAWQAAATIGYRFRLGSASGAVHLGYRALGQDYSDGDFTWDVIAHGPVLGIGFAF
jgi:hypothetical protein